MEDKIEQPQDADLREKLTHKDASELYIKIQAIREADYYEYVVALVRVFEAAGYRSPEYVWNQTMEAKKSGWDDCEKFYKARCEKREWPLLTDTQLLEADDKLGEEYFDELDQHKAWLMDRRNIAQAQRANDMKQCPAQKEGK